MMLKLSVQDTLVPGENLETKFANAVAAGYDAIELRAKPGAFAERADEFRSAVAAGVRIASACMDAGTGYLGSFESDARRRARQEIAEVVTVLGEIAPGAGLVFPNGCSVFSTYLPPFVPPVKRAEAISWLVDGVADVAEVAAQAGVRLFLEPLNRYEDWAVNTLAQAAEVVAQVGNPAVGLCLDTFHAQIEEADLAASIRAAGPLLAHVQLGDSNRLEPGKGHLDWTALIAALNQTGFDGWLALECFLSAPGMAAITDAARTIRTAEQAARSTQMENQ